jgi:hypothetical protein
MLHKNQLSTAERKELDTLRKKELGRLRVIEEIINIYDMDKLNKKQGVVCDISTKPILTEEEACMFLGVSRKTIFDLRTSGKIGFCKEKDKDKKIKAIRYKREHLLDYIRKNYDEVQPVKLAYT